MTDDNELLDSPPQLRLDGKVAWITGASRGLGRAIAFAMAGAGADVLLTARDPDALDGVASAIRSAGRTALVVPGAVDRPVDVAGAVDAAREAWGRLDVVVNNAGVGASYRRAEAVDQDEWRRVLDVNLVGAFACAHAAFPLLVAAGGGSVINVSSVHGLVGGARLATYAASKGGLELLTRTLALEWADRGVRVNSIAPGYLETDMTAELREHEHVVADLLARVPLGRFGQVAEIAAAALFLAAPASSYVTGATLCADGGWTAQ